MQKGIVYKILLFSILFTMCALQTAVAQEMGKLRLKAISFKASHISKNFNRKSNDEKLGLVMEYEGKNISKLVKENFYYLSRKTGIPTTVSVTTAAVVYTYFTKSVSLKLGNKKRSKLKLNLDDDDDFSILYNYKLSW